MFFGRGNKRKALAKVKALYVIIVENAISDPELFVTAIDLLAEITYHIGGTEGMELLEEYMKRRRSDNGRQQ